MTIDNLQYVCEVLETRLREEIHSVTVDDWNSESAHIIIYPEKYTNLRSLSPKIKSFFKYSIDRDFTVSYDQDLGYYSIDTPYVYDVVDFDFVRAYKEGTEANEIKRIKKEELKFLRKMALNKTIELLLTNNSEKVIDSTLLKEDNNEVTYQYNTYIKMNFNEFICKINFAIFNKKSLKSNTNNVLDSLKKDIKLRLDNSDKPQIIMEHIVKDISKEEFLYSYDNFTLDKITDKMVVKTITQAISK